MAKKMELATASENKKFIYESHVVRLKILLEDLGRATAWLEENVLDGFQNDNFQDFIRLAEHWQDRKGELVNGISEEFRALEDLAYFESAVREEMEENNE